MLRELLSSAEADELGVIRLSRKDLDAKVIPVFPRERSITVKGYSVRRRQVPMCPAFSLTDYKVQGSTLMTAVLDLKDDPAAKGQDGQKKYCSTYVQLSRLRSLDGLHLLQRIDMEDHRFRPDDRLLTEMGRLGRLEQEIMVAWAGQLNILIAIQLLVLTIYANSCLFSVPLLDRLWTLAFSAMMSTWR